MSSLRIVRTFCHPDEVSGTSVLSDGTKAYWGERIVVFVKPDGTAWEETSWVPPAMQSDHLAVILNDECNHRMEPMTMAQLIEWEECFSMLVGQNEMAVAC